MEAEHFIPTLILHDLLRLPYFRMLHLFFSTRQGLGLRINSVSIKLGLSQK